MKEIQVEITADGMAKEVNALGDEPSPYFHKKKKAWQKVEQNRRVFKIVNSGELFNYGFNTIEGKYLEYDYIHTAEIVNENEVIIK